jgi:hypothetical protein
MPQLRSVSILTAVLIICAVAVFDRTTRAADDPVHPGKAQEIAGKAQQPATATPASPAKPAGASKSPPPGSPQVPEESASVRDDPTIAPDAKQSADNDVSFPNDI